MDPNQDHRLLVSLYARQTHKRLEMPDCGENNPYHLLFYMLPRLKFIDHGGVVEYYYPKFQNTYIGEAALAALPSRFMREIKKQEGIEYMELPPVMCGVDSIIDPWVYEYVRDLYKDCWKDTVQQKKKYTYISRRKTQFQSRMVLNEDEYLKEVRDMGFSIYCMEDLTFTEQIRLFRSSEIITGPHGAALSFSIFCEPRTIVCEIMRDIPNKGHFSDIARKLGLTFFRYTGISEYEEQHNNMKIHKDSYLASLREMINLKLREK